MDSTQLIVIHQLAGVGWMTLKKIMDVNWTPGNPVSSGLLAELSHLSNGKKHWSPCRSC
jgi:hypothetical protein